MSVHTLSPQLDALTASSKEASRASQAERGILRCGCFRPTKPKGQVRLFSTGVYISARPLAAALGLRHAGGHRQTRIGERLADVTRSAR